MALTLDTLAALGPKSLGLRRIGTGAQSVVYLLPGDMTADGRTNLVYKMYRPKSPSLQGRAAATKVALDRLISLRRSLKGRPRTAIDQHVAWPLAVVADDGVALGVIESNVDAAFLGASPNDPTPAVPLERFIRPASDHGLLAEQGLHPLKDDGRRRIALQLAATGTLLHRMGLVIGDVSLRNVMAFVPAHGQGRHAAAAFIDADACRIADEGCGLPQGSTPLFDTPESNAWRRTADAAPDDARRRFALAMAALQTQQSDVYKIALLILRLCSCEMPQPTGVRQIRSNAQRRLLTNLFDRDGLQAVEDALCDDPADRPAMAELYRSLCRGTSPSAANTGTPPTLSTPSAPSTHRSESR